MFSMNHEDGFLDLNPSDFIREDWERIEAKALQVLIALRVNDPRLLIGGELDEC
jgi:hypothetical protein